MHYGTKYIKHSKGRAFQHSTEDMMHCGTKYMKYSKRSPKVSSQDTMHYGTKYIKHSKGKSTILK